jgi:hypothetical protein
MVTLRFDNIEINPNDIVEVAWSNNVSCLLKTDNTTVRIDDPFQFVRQAVKMFRYREIDCEVAFGYWGVTVTTGNQVNGFEDLVGAADQIAILQKRAKA